MRHAHGIMQIAMFDEGVMVRPAETPRAFPHHRDGSVCTAIKSD
jgi:hypothetical protein